jgi:hypothetical protein
VAVWQFDVILVPHAALAARLDEFASVDPIGWLSKDERDQPWWLDRQPVPGLFAALDALLTRSTETADRIQWGPDDGNRVDVLLENGKIEEILIRIDLREPDPQFIDGVTELAANLGCDFLTMDGSFGEADGPTLAMLIRNSRALRFVRDPMTFLRRVAAGGIEDA